MTKKVIEINVKREQMETVVQLKVVPEIEAFFKKAAAKNSTKTETSSKWLDKNDQGLKFYTKYSKMNGLVPSVPVIDNFGNGLMDGDRINVALLRIVGTSEGDGVTIKTDDLMPYEEIMEYVKKLADWTREFYQNNLRDNIVSSSITLTEDSSEDEDEDEDSDDF